MSAARMPGFKSDMSKRFAKPGRGVADHGNPDVRRIVVSWEVQTFDEIRARAERNGSSFAQAVRELVELGLEAELEGGEPLDTILTNRT